MSELKVTVTNEHQLSAQLRSVAIFARKNLNRGVKTYITVTASTEPPVQKKQDES